MNFAKGFLALCVTSLYLVGCFFSGEVYANAGADVSKVRINWLPIPGAVSYRLEIMKSDASSIENRVAVKNRIPTAGYELDATKIPEIRRCFWRVAPIGYNGNVVGEFSKLKPIDREEINPTAPRITSEFNRMEYFPLYPVYSWIPVLGSGGYDIRISRENKATPGKYKVLRELSTDSNVFYEYGGYTWPGNYMWQVRSRDKQGKPNTEWSDPCYFKVEQTVKVATLGDSITHGGGACNTPPGYVMYSWETYSKVPIKNLGRSGDTVQDMLSRFDSDVVCFSPKILVIMGGVNNFRAGEDAWETIDAMEKILEECNYHKIIPVFATATPINAALMHRTDMVEDPVDSWKYQQQVLNQWIKQQTYHVDVTPALTDANGQLKAEFTTDGLHPDADGKRIIGEAIGDYLLKTFPEYDLLKK